MNNIFKDAYFGKLYKTRDGRKAIYLGTFYNEKHFPHRIAVEDAGTYGYPENGKYIKDREYLDIVSEWEEEIDEESIKLDARANMPFYCYSESNKDCADAFVEGALYGYHKAKK